MDIQIIVDSCCDLTPALRNLLRVSVASLKIDVGSIHYVDDERIDTKKLIADMKAYKNAPSTACPSPDEYAALMEKSEESFVVTLSGKLSGSYNAACVGREMVLERSPEKKIHIFDSESASAGETLIALMLRDRIDGGHSFEDIVAEMTAFIARMKTRFVLEDLSNLVKNGRISKVAGLLSGHAFAAAHHGRRRPRQHRGHRKGARHPERHAPSGGAHRRRHAGGRSLQPDDGAELLQLPRARHDAEKGISGKMCGTARGDPGAHQRPVHGIRLRWRHRAGLLKNVKQQPPEAGVCPFPTVVFCV